MTFVGVAAKDVEVGDTILWSPMQPGERVQPEQVLSVEPCYYDATAFVIRTESRTQECREGELVQVEFTDFE